MMRFAVAAVFLLALAACEEGRNPAPVPAPAAAKPAPAPHGEKPAPTLAAKPPVKAGKLTEIGLEAFFPRQQAGTVLLYDARPPFVVAFGKIPGAINWPRGDYASKLSTRESEITAARKAGKLVVIYCTDAACPDAQAIGEKLVARGHDVSILEGGFADWKAAGMPTE
jgi:rhodanese-related sulfurtransferase